MKTTFIVSFFVCMMLIASIAWSEIVYVNGTTGNDATGQRGNPDKPFKTIQKGIDVAVAGDTVLVADGRYTGAGNKNLDFKGKAIIVRSENGAENCIIDCEGDGRGFYFHSGETSDSVVDGFIITNGYVYSEMSSAGGGVYCYGSSPTITNCSITQNSVYGALFTFGGLFCYGGGIFCESSSPTIINCSITQNSVRGDGGVEAGVFCAGGGIYCHMYSAPTITNCTITQNSVYAGGLIYCCAGGGIYCEYDSSPTMTNCSITQNSIHCPGGTMGPGIGGGGIYCYDYSSPMITNCIITGNLAEMGSGGGIGCSYSSSPMITNCIITGNLAEMGHGGGIDCGYYSSPTIINNVISGNSAVGDWLGGFGGGIHCYYDTFLTIINSTISGNSAAVGGGGIYCDGSSLVVLNTILWADSPKEICSNYSSIIITYSDIQGGWPGKGNIKANPMFVNPGNGIYYLQAGSPCLGTANCEGAPETDKDGEPRPLGSGCDMGCYEECDGGIFGYVSSSNCDVSAYDASLVLQSVVGLINLSERQRIAADVTGNGTVTALDAALILQYTVGLITQFPVQKGAPILAVKDENQILTEIIAELENVPLTTEQRHVLEQLKQLIGQQSLPGHTVLLQNYPNPFNPETWIPFKLAQDASVTIRIYNVKGQLIRVLHLGNKNAGVYMTKDKAAHWDGKDSLGQSVASGMYFYTLQTEHIDGNGAGKYNTTRKMVIVK